MIQINLIIYIDHTLVKLTRELNSLMPTTTAIQGIQFKSAVVFLNTTTMDFIKLFSSDKPNFIGYFKE